MWLLSFQGFNKEIEEIKRAQTQYAIPDPDLRESLKRDNRAFIVPKYHSFYDKSVPLDPIECALFWTTQFVCFNRYVGTSFTRNLDKYVKYRPVEVAALIDMFFDAAAWATRIFIVVSMVRYLYRLHVQNLYL